MSRSWFISFEGIDGAGKSTHIEGLSQWFKSKGHVVTLTREPGGTPLAEKFRELALHETMDPLTEALVMFAAPVPEDASTFPYSAIAFVIFVVPIALNAPVLAFMPYI